MIIDAHAHLDYEPKDFVRNTLDRGLVDIVALSSVYLSSVCGSAFPTLEELRQANDHVLRFMGEYPGRVIGFAYVNPRLGDEGVRELERCFAAGMQGVKLWISVLADDSRVVPLIELAAQANATVLAHAWVKTTGNLPYESRPENVVNLAERFPQINFILAHFGGEWETGAKAVRGCPNLYVDISGTLADMDSIEVLVRNVGIERVLFGTDNQDFYYCLGKVYGAELSEEERRKILCKNACTLFGI